jgi:hypothetical protein
VTARPNGASAGAGAVPTQHAEAGCRRPIPGIAGLVAQACKHADHWRITVGALPACRGASGSIPRPSCP